MRKTNYHTHSSFCDGKGSLEEYVESAIGRGMVALGFSGHAPLPFPNEWTMSEENLPAYLEDVRRLRDTYRGSIEIYLGLEADYLDASHNPASQRYEELGLDYRIGSAHHIHSPEQGAYVPVDSTPEEIDRLLKETFSGNVPAMVTAYYEAVREMVKTGGFEILGHLDLIKKHNAGSRYFDENDDWYREEVERTLRVIAGHVGTPEGHTEVVGAHTDGKEARFPIIEVNTGAMARGYTDEPYPSPWIIERAAQLGLPIMLNADAHRPEWVDYAFETADNIIRRSGYSSRWILYGGEWREVNYE